MSSSKDDFFLDGGKNDESKEKLYAKLIGIIRSYQYRKLLTLQESYELMSWMIGNAIPFLERGGKVDVDVRRIMQERIDAGYRIGSEHLNSRKKLL